MGMSTDSTGNVNKTKKEIDFWIQSACGIQFNNPISVFTISHDYCRRLTWAEKQRDKLVWKLKKRKALRNRFFVISLMVIICPIIISGSVFLVFLTNSELVAIGAGYASFNLIRLVYYWLEDIIECCPGFVKIKHKGKIYS